jgi:hypothetical protein
MEAAMINDVVLEGIVVKAWKYADDLLFRLACYRDPDMPQKPLNETQDAADFVTIRVPKGKLARSIQLPDAPNYVQLRTVATFSPA